MKVCYIESRLNSYQLATKLASVFCELHKVQVVNVLNSILSVLIIILFVHRSFQEHDNLIGNISIA